MPTETSLPRHSPKSLIATPAAALAALLCLAPGVGFADSKHADDIRVEKVSLAGLDLTTPEGARAAYARVKIVAARLCRELVSTESIISVRETYAACLRDSLTDVARRINLQTLASLDKLRSEH